jgi:hypothetical protein
MDNDDDDNRMHLMLLLLFLTVLSRQVTTGTRGVSGVSSVVEFDIDKERPASIGPFLLLFFPLDELVTFFFEQGRASPHITQHLQTSGGHGLLLIYSGKFTNSFN